jgi:hypothetical protein
MISRIKDNDIAGMISVLSGKFGWSEKDPERRFYIQNVIIGTVVSHETDGNPILYLKPWDGGAGDTAEAPEDNGNEQ